MISAAKPKIADYPFTTLEPNLGVVKIDEHTDFVVADIPGLIEGASEGKGLGHQFLRHIERARVLCVMVDLAAADEVSPQEQERILLHELGQYQPELLERPRLVVGTKADIAVADWDGAADLGSHRRQGVRELVGRMASLVHEARSEQPRETGIVIIRPEADGARVERLGEHEFRLDRPAGRTRRRAERRHHARGAVVHRPPDEAPRRAEDPGPRRCARRRRRLGRRIQLRVPAGRRRCGVVAKIGTSSLTDALGVIDEHVIDDAVRSARRAARRGSRGRPRHLRRGVGRCRRARAVGAADRHADAAGARRRGPEPPDGARTTGRSARHGLVAAQVLLVPHDFVDRRQYLHARQTLAATARARLRPDRQRERRDRQSTRSATATTTASLRSWPTTSAPTCSCCSPTRTGLYTADPRARSGGRADQRGAGRRPAADGRRRRNAAPVAGQRWHGLEARRGADGLVVRVRGGHRSGRACRRAGRRRSPASTVGTTFSPATAGCRLGKLWIGFASQVEGVVSVDDGREARAWSSAARRCLPAGVTGVIGELRRGRRRRGARWNECGRRQGHGSQ